MVIIFLRPLLGQAYQPDKPILAYGDQARGEITRSGEAQNWFFEGQAGDIILIDMFVPPNTRLDPYLQLLDPDNRRLQENDDSGISTNAHLGPYRLPQAGRYQIVAAGSSGIGAYTLQLTSTATMPTLSPDKPLDLNFDLQTPRHYLLYENARAGLLRLESNGQNPIAPPFFYLYTLNGDLVRTSAYQSAGVIDPFIAEAQTAYIIAAEIPFPQPNQGYTFSIKLSLSKVDLLHSGSQIEGNLSSAATAVHYFWGEGGQHLAMTLEVISGDVSPAVYIRSVEGDPPLFSSTGSHVDTLNIQLNIPKTALYTIELGEGAYRGQSGRYRLKLTIQ